MCFVFSRAASIVFKVSTDFGCQTNGCIHFSPGRYHYFAHLIAVLCFSCNLAASIVLSTNVGCQIKLQISYIANLTTCKTFCPVVFLIRPHAPTIAANSRWTLDAKQSCAFFHGLNRINLWNSGLCIFVASSRTHERAKSRTYFGY